MSYSKNADTALFYRSLEEQAARHRLRPISLSGLGTAPLGLLLVNQDLPGAEVASALLRLARSEGMSGNITCRDTAGPGDTCQVTVEERAQLWMRPKPEKRKNTGSVPNLMS